MSQIPDPIEATIETKGGNTCERPDGEVLAELVERFNQLVTYLDSISERL